MASRIVTRYYELVDERDFAGVLELFAEDAWYERPGYERMSGREALYRFYNEERVISSGRHTVEQMLEVKDHVAVQGHFEGELVSGDAVVLRFADFFQLRGDSILTRRTYFYAKLA